MKKFLIIATTFAVLSPLIILTMLYFSIQSPQEIISHDLNLDVTAGEVISDYDKRGYRKERRSCIILKFREDDKLLAEIKKSDHWRGLPFDPITSIVLYRDKTKPDNPSPYLTDDNGKPLVPTITEGYYTLIDRQIEATKNLYDSEDEDLKFASLNLTIGIYDTKNHLLYYCVLDKPPRRPAL